MTGFKLMVPLSTSGKATSQKFQTETLPPVACVVAVTMRVEVAVMLAGTLPAVVVGAVRCLHHAPEADIRAGLQHVCFVPL